MPRLPCACHACDTLQCMGPIWQLLKCTFAALAEVALCCTHMLLHAKQYSNGREHELIISRRHDEATVERLQEPYVAPQRRNCTRWCLCMSACIRR